VLGENCKSYNTKGNQVNIPGLGFMKWIFILDLSNFERSGDALLFKELFIETQRSLLLSLIECYIFRFT